MRDSEHNRIAKKLDALDALRPKVALGFIVFWSLLAVAFIATILHYWVL